MSKYGNRKCHFDNGSEKIKFDSVAERARYVDLLDIERRGVISDLKLQPRFLLLEKFCRHGTQFRAEFYIADFEYFQDGKRVVEDVKGVATREYLNKRKHFLALNPDIVFREVKLKQKVRWEVTEL